MRSKLLDSSIGLLISTSNTWNCELKPAQTEVADKVTDKVQAASQQVASQQAASQQAASQQAAGPTVNEQFNQVKIEIQALQEEISDPLHSDPVQFDPVHFDTSSKRGTNDTGTNDKGAHDETDEAAIKWSGETFLGYKWNPKDNVIKFSTAVSINKKVNGIKSGPDLSQGDIEGEKVTSTLKNLLRLVAHFYDPGGTCITSRTSQQRIRWIQYSRLKVSDQTQVQWYSTVGEKCLTKFKSSDTVRLVWTQWYSTSSLNPVIQYV